MTHTLLDAVQAIASSMDADEVNSINDNTESLQIAYIVRDSYNEIVSRLELPKHFNFFELTASGTSAKPTLMYLPSNVKSVEFIKYDNCDTDAGDTSPKFLPVTFKMLDQFLVDMSKLDSDTMDNVISFSHTVAGQGTFEFLCINNKFPSCYTTWDDYTIVFDSYDADNDTTLVGNKTQGYGEISQTFTLADSFVIPFDDRQYTLLINEAKSQAFAELKQVQNVIADKRARRGWINEQKTKKKIKSNRYQDLDLPDYGWKR